VFYKKEVEMEIKRALEQVRDIGTLDIEDLMDLTKKFDCRKVVLAIYLVDGKIITVEEAVESFEKGDNFFLVSN
jgi:hypothetical protein